MNLQEFFNDNKRIAVAFSGGVDSAYLLYAARHFGATVKAYYIKSQFQPAFELEDAAMVAGLLHVPMEVIEVDVLHDAECRERSEGTYNGDSIIAKNPPDRCYYCKRRIFETILKRAGKDGFKVIADGTNASDDISDRPGFRAIHELGIKSPLREAGLTKDEIRRLSEDAGLPTFNKPAYACLATRIPAGEIITKEKLAQTEKAECFMMSLGFKDFRVRQQNGEARLEISEKELALFEKLKKNIFYKLDSMYNIVSREVKNRK